MYNGQCAKETEIIDRGELIECSKIDLMSENQDAFNMWQILSERDRAIHIIGNKIIEWYIPERAISGICKTYGRGLDTYHKILKIDKLMPLRKHNNGRD